MTQLTQALADALVLSVTAPDDERAQESLDLAESLTVGMDASEVDVAKLIAENTLAADADPDTVWLLTFSCEPDPDDGQFMRRIQSLHRTRNSALFRLFDTTYERTGLEPGFIDSVNSVTREDGAQFADLYAVDPGEAMAFSIVPLKIEAGS